MNSKKRRRTNKKRRSGLYRTKRVARTPAKPSSAKAKRFQNTSSRLASVLAKMRADDVSLRRASRDIGIHPRTVIRRAGSALKKNEGGRYSAKPSDRLERALLVPTPEGPREITVRGLRDASRLSRYWIALHRYYETGEASDLRKFTGQFITDTGGTKFPFLTDLNILDRLGSAGVVSFESIYSWSEQ